MITRVPVNDKMFTITTDIEVDSLIVNYDDIEGNVEYDEPPWENCDGLEHEFNGPGWDDHPDHKDSYKYVNRSRRGSGYIEIDEDDVIKWGCTGYPGCSKQVRFEEIARAKRETTELLVKWYEQGWEYFVATANYGDYTDAIGGIDSYEYAQELVEKLRMDIAENIERDGYIVENKPDPT